MCISLHNLRLKYWFLPSFGFPELLRKYDKKCEEKQVVCLMVSNTLTNNKTVSHRANVAAPLTQ